MITHNSIESLKSKIDITDVIGGFVELKRSGATYKGRCPFHEERTASFTVNPARGTYYCFGCGAKGDMISFVQEFSKLSFSDAVQKLADDHNITLEYTVGEKPREKRDPLPLETLKRLFVARLEQTPFAAEYLKTRGLGAAMIEHFEIGYAPESDEQLAVLKRENIPIGNALKAGVLVEDERGRVYARFTKRVMFPIYNHSGALVGFGGRTLGDHPAKYINSPQSAFFNKSALLFALGKAREGILKEKTVIVCEGYMDAVMLHQAGFTHAVATLGTALTHEHLPLLKRLDNPRVILSYDSDHAGKEAAFKAAKLLCEHDFLGGVAVIEGGKDPAELIEQSKTVQLAEYYRQAAAFHRFVIDELQSRAATKDEAYREIAAFVKTLSRFRAEEAKNYAAAVLGIDPRRFSLTVPMERAANRKRNIGELELIKTLALNGELHERLIDYIDSALFDTHGDLFNALRRGDESALYELLGDELIVPLAAEQTQEAVRKRLLDFYTKEMRRLRSGEQVEVLLELRGIVDRLKKGSLVAFRRMGN